MKTTSEIKETIIEKSWIDGGVQVIITKEWL